MPRGGQFEYYFEEVGRGVDEGAQDPRAEHFSGSNVEDAVVREVIQNSLDARRRGADVVEIEFELGQLNLEQLPGIHGLRRAAASAAADVGDSTEGAARIRSVHEHLQYPSVSLLRISDFGTTGLEGDENGTDGGLKALTRSSGVSASGGGRGGSFGIGAAVGVMASGVGTVGYVTRRAGDEETVYASWSQLTGFKDEQQKQRRARGILTHSDTHDRLSYPRFGVEGFGPFEHRTELGTTVLIFDYLRSEADAELHAIRRAVLRNFLVAVLEGDLIVTGRGVASEWRLDTSTLTNALQDDGEMREKIAPFRSAMDQEPIVKTLPRVGEVELRIFELLPNTDGLMPKSLDTMLMRKPRMLIDIMKHRGLPKPYAAVFICRNEKGNELLRGLEGPSHDGWKSRGVRGDSALVGIVRNFIKVSLREALGFRTSDSLDVEQLSRMLPKIERGFGSDGIFTHESDGPQKEETWGTVPGSTDRTGEPDPQGPRPIPVPVPQPAPTDRKSNEEEPAGRTPERESASDGQVPEGDGGDTKRMDAESLAIRSFAGGEPNEVTVIVRNPTRDAVSTSLVIHWLDGNNVSTPVTVERARDMNTGETLNPSRREGELAPLTFEPESRRRIALTLAEGAQVKLEVSYRA